MTPDWDDLPAFARTELEREPALHHLRPRLLFFHDGEASLYARTRTPRPSEDPAVVAQQVLFEVAALSVFAQPDAAASIMQCRLSDHEGADRDQDVHAQPALLVQRAWSDEGGRLAHDATLLPFGRTDDGGIRWEPPLPCTELPTDQILARSIGHGEPLVPPNGMPPNGMAYALTKFGHVIAVGDDWRSRLGFDQPVAPRLVRAADRRRAELLQRRHRDRRRRQATAGSGGGR